MTFDEKAAQALKNTAEARKKQMLTIPKKHRFSLSYKLWEYKMLRDIRRNRINSHWRIKRLRIAIASCAAALSLLIGGSVYAAVNMGRYSLDTKPDYSKLFIENAPADKTSIEEYYGLDEESGWELVEYNVGAFSTMLIYECDGRQAVLGQRLILGNIGNIDTENATVEQISVYEDNDGLFIEHQDGSVSLYWIYDGYLFDIGGDITKNEALNLVHSTKIINL